MVRIVHTPPILKVLKHIYDKPTWPRLKLLYADFAQKNPTLGYLVLPFSVYLVFVSVGVTYYKYAHPRPRGKYYEYVRIMRPDDPAVATIVKDDSLTINNTLRTNSTLHVADF